MIPWEWWGESLAYPETHARQHVRRQAILEGSGQECLALLEHQPVVTVGRREAPGTPSPALLAEQGISFFETERGGLATYHGPGQLMGYLLCSLPRHGLKLREVVGALEGGLIRFLAGHGIEAERQCGHPGVWVEGKKIGSIGLHLKHGVSMHGFCLNLSPAMDHFSLLQPCGLSPEAITSVDHWLSACPSASEAAPSVAREVLGAMAAIRHLDGTGARE